MQKVLFISSSIKKLDEMRNEYGNALQGQYLVLASNSLLDGVGAFVPECIVVYLEGARRQVLFPLIDLRENLRFRSLPLILLSDEEDRGVFKANVKPGPDYILPAYTGMDGLKKVINKIFEESTPLKHVLIVDDDPVALKVVKGYLDQFFKVTCVNSGEKALKFLEKTYPDCILLDCFMPEMDGPTTLSKIRQLERDRRIPVVFLTGNSEREMVMSCVSLHPSGFLLKPVNQNELIRKLKEVIG